MAIGKWNEKVGLTKDSSQGKQWWGMAAALSHPMVKVTRGYVHCTSKVGRGDIYTPPNLLLKRMFSVCSRRYFRDFEAQLLMGATWSEHSFLFFGFSFFSLSSCFTCTTWNHLPDRLTVPKFLCQGHFVRETQTQTITKMKLFLSQSVT